MKARMLFVATVSLFMFCFVSFSFSAVIDFTGGTATFLDGTTAVTTPGFEELNPIDYYIENGFKLDFINANTPSIFGEFIGDYYGPDATGNNNDVIHGHWQSGGISDMTAIEITKVGGGTFDLNYFILTSNTDLGGGPASGNELTYVEAWAAGVMTHRQLLPADSWGWDGVHNLGPLQNDPAIFLGPEFDAVDLVRFTVDNAVDCFGMDEFFIDQPPPTIPEPGTLLLLGTGLVGLAGYGRRKRKQ